MPAQTPTPADAIRSIRLFHAAYERATRLDPRASRTRTRWTLDRTAIPGRNAR